MTAPDQPAVPGITSTGDGVIETWMNTGPSVWIEDPSAVAGVPAEAVEAAADVIFQGSLATRADAEAAAWDILAATAPHLRAQFLAEVDAALRDQEQVKDWLRRGDMNRRAIGFPAAADYLRDTLAGDGGEA